MGSLYPDTMETKSSRLGSHVKPYIRGPLLWTGEELHGQHDSFTVGLEKLDIFDIDEALSNFNALGVDRDDISSQTFRFREGSSLAHRLTECAEAIHHGRGFCVVTGLDASKYSAADVTSIYLGLASYIADQRGVQDKQGNVLSHITSSKLWTKTPVAQRHGIHSTVSLPFHNDMGCDILALQCRHGAEQGGATYLSSAVTAVRLLFQEEPEALMCLMSPTWPVQISGDGAPYYLAPAIAIHNGQLLVSMDPNRFGPHPDSVRAGVPSLTPEQQRALHCLSEAARQSELRVELCAGDMLFFNNWALLHRRDAYEDADDTSRHLVRLWLRNSQLGWDVPESMRMPWEAAYGQSTKGKNRRYPLEPRATYEVPKYTAGSAAFVLE